MENTTVEDKIQKKVCTEAQKQVSRIAYPPQKINITIYNQIDPESLKKFHPLKTIQNLLMWLLGKGSINPMWLLVHNKHLIKHGIFLDISIQDDEDKKESQAEMLEMEYQKVKFSCENQFYDNSHFWNLIFHTKVQDEPSFKKKHTNAKVKPQSYTEQIYEKYSNYLLNQDELKKNLYPTTKDYQNVHKKTTENLKSVNILGVDCEMVTTSSGLELARISVVDFDFNVIMDEYVVPENKILDYNTKWSGITEESLKGVKTTVQDIQERFFKIIDENTILIGHSLENDLKALKINHQKVIDTSLLYMTLSDRKLSLKVLAKKYLHLNIQQNDHDSVEDAKIALSLAKLRIDIFDNFNQSNFQPQNDVPDVLINLQKQGQVCILDEEQQIEQFTKYNLKKFEEIQSSSFLSKKQYIFKNG